MQEVANSNELWLAQKLGKFSSSENHKLLVEGKKDEIWGDAAIGYIDEKVSEIITGETAFSYTSADMQWGKDNEMDALLTYQREYANGLQVQYFGGSNPIFVEYGDHAGGSPDGYVGDDGLLEIKCPSSAVHVKYLRMTKQEQLSKACKNYYCQIQCNLLFCKKQWAHFISYDPRVINHRHRLKVLKIERDDLMIEKIEARINLASQELKNILYDIGYIDRPKPEIKLTKIN